MTLPAFASVHKDYVFDLLRRQDGIVLCATNRIARNLALEYGRRQRATGAATWPTPSIFTLDDWLKDLGEQLVLQEAVPVADIPNQILSPVQACYVWKQSIALVARDDPALPLFDLHGLAQTAVEADALLKTWNLKLDQFEQTEEARQFLLWRKRFNEVCLQQGWLEFIAYQQKIVGWLERGAGALPANVVLAGFDLLSPHQRALLDVLKKRGAAVFDLAFSSCPAASMSVRACKDTEAECWVAARWAKQVLEANAGARIGIVVSDLEHRRATIIPVLDEVLSPDLLRNATDTPSEHYNVSLGLPLPRYGLVETAFALLHLLANKQGLPLTEFGKLLRLPYWSADQSEADWRAQLDATLRERPGQTISISSVLRIASLHDQTGKCRLIQHLRALEIEQQRKPLKVHPSEWAQRFSTLLTKLEWPGERTLTATEMQTRAAFFEMLTRFAELDLFLGEIRIGEAISEFYRLCQGRIFQPKTVGEPAIQVLGLIEAKGAEFDFLWVMGMNNQHWPPPAKPNPLLSALMQRQAKVPSASAEVQTNFARDIFKRLCHCAVNITFSFAEKEGERELLPSPLITELLRTRADVALATSFTPQVGDEADRACLFERIDDHAAPPVAEGEKVSGGSGLLKAQAICPAWAFYRYRLGAKQLAIPSEGVDASQRGTLVHAVLEKFWGTMIDSISLDKLEHERLQESIVVAVTDALTQFEQTLGESLPATFYQLEHDRLQQLCTEWLALERSGKRLPFRVIAREQKHQVTLGKLRISLVIDRVDELLSDGRRVVLDYKTGQKNDYASWFGDGRITEPQLPLYAALVLHQTAESAVAAVAFARVRTGQCQFQGIAAEEGILPRINVIAPVHSEAHLQQHNAIEVDAWQALIDSWKIRIEDIANEIQRGEAAVRFDDEAALDYCEVKPLLRLAERKTQFEEFSRGLV